MKSTIILVLLLIILLDLPTVIAQNKLHEFKEYKKAQLNQTRTDTGLPGPKYWQNQTDYRLEAELDVDHDRLIGVGSLTYHNQSPDTLREMVIRLYQNRYKKGAIHNMPIHPGDLHDGVILRNWKVDEHRLNLDSIQYLFHPKIPCPDLCELESNLIVNLPRKLNPGENVELGFEWEFPIPKHSAARRTGKSLKGAYFIGLWYPQVAVYDDLNGWDVSPHLGMPEFYNDFNNFEVKVKVPEGYLVWATGELLNESMVYPEFIQDRLKQARNSSEPVDILTAGDNPVIKATEWHFKATDVTDFAFAVAKGFHWKGSSVEVEEGRRVLTDLVYSPEATYLGKMLPAAVATVEYTSKQIPGVPFPYSHATSFEGQNAWLGLAVEFPMLSNVPDNPSYITSLTTVVHEIAHNYLPFYLGIDETRNFWLEEGFTSLLEFKIVEQLFPDSSGFRDYSQVIFQNDVNSSINELPLIASSYSSTNIYNIRYTIYTKPLLFFLELEALLGESVFRNCIREFVTIWHQKHPKPYDLINTIERVTGENLDWFWRPWLFEFLNPDLAVSLSNSKTVNINNEGNLPLPIHLKITYTDDSLFEIKETARIWAKGDRSVSWKHKKPIRKVELLEDFKLDANPANNKFEISPNLRQAKTNIDK